MNKPENNDGIIMPAGLVYSPGFSALKKELTKLLTTFIPGDFQLPAYAGLQVTQLIN
jgi:hypothetical protein